MLIVSLILLAICCIHATASSANARGTTDQTETIQTIRFTDSAGNEVTELAFRAPAKGVPKQVINVFCANVKIRLYWGVYRETIKSTARTGQDVRRMARLARHYYPEIRAVDDPFDAPRLSKVDEWLGVKETDRGEAFHDSSLVFSDTDSEEQGEGRLEQSKVKIKRKLSVKHEDDEDANKEIKQMMDASVNGGFDDNAESTKTDKMFTKAKKRRLERLRDQVKRYATKVGMGAYTRWATMWWLMMSCLYTKYYLWDPALDEFIKLKKTMIMYPDFSLLKLQDIECLPTRFFQRIISACKTLNPLLNYDFGQLSLDSMMRFKGRAD